MVRYPWVRTEAALRELAKYSDNGIAELDYVNPETGEPALPTLGFTAMYLPGGQTLAPPLRSCSSAIHVVKGRGRTMVNGETFDWESKDTMSIPVFAEVTHEASEDAFLIRVHDRPIQETLRYYEERKR